MINSCCRPVLALLLLLDASQAADLSSIGSWSESLTAANLVSGAGSDLQNQIESVSGVTALTISNAPGPWSVRARLSSSQWNSNFTLFVRRSSAGSGSGTISGAEGYIEITGSDSEIFSGSENRGSISLQFKLTGLAGNISVATYLSSIIFTVQ
ncbi:MAG: hypothetical protein V7609_2151 [Verrucomicrobiota bacterium]